MGKRILGYRAGIVEGCRLLAWRVKVGETLDEALDDTLRRGNYAHLDDSAYAGISEVFSWLSSLDLDGPEEYFCPIHGNLGSSECPRC